MAAIIQLRRGTAAAWTAANPVLADGELAAEKDTLKVKMGNGVTAWNLLPYAFSLITLSDANETNRGIVEEATDAEIAAATGNGATGARLFVSPPKLAAALVKSVTLAGAGSGSINIDCLLHPQLKVVLSTVVSGNITFTKSNDSNLEILNISLPLTGSGIAITWPSDTRMDRIFEGGVWNPTTKVLTVSSIGTADIFEFSLMKSGSVFILRYGGPARA